MPHSCNALVTLILSNVGIRLQGAYSPYIPLWNCSHSVNFFTFLCFGFGSWLYFCYVLTVPKELCKIIYLSLTWLPSTRNSNNTESFWLYLTLQHHLQVTNQYYIWLFFFFFTFNIIPTHIEHFLLLNWWRFQLSLWAFMVSTVLSKETLCERKWKDLRGCALCPGDTLYDF